MYDEENFCSNIDNLQFLTPNDVMDILNIGRNTFYKLVNDGKLNGFRIGKMWRIHPKDLDDFRG